MKREEVGECRFCRRPIMRGEFQDIHHDGKMACISCYINLNDTLERIQRYWFHYHYVVEKGSL
jgi:hypothetical protein